MYNIKQVKIRDKFSQCQSYNTISMSYRLSIIFVYILCWITDTVVINYLEINNTIKCIRLFFLCFFKAYNCSDNNINTFLSGQVVAVEYYSIYIQLER